VQGDPAVGFWHFAETKERGLLSPPVSLVPFCFANKIAVAAALGHQSRSTTFLANPQLITGYSPHEQC
jgi:hypothetical protein